jgi:Zn-dependent protease
MLGTILFLTIGFGWGKPVPVNPYYFKHPTRDSAITAFAGPLSNFLLALVAFVVLVVFNHFSPNTNDVWALLSPEYAGPNVLMKFCLNFLSVFLFTNLGLMAFNLLPVAPLDGSKVLQLFIPARYEMEYERIMGYGPYVLLGLLIASHTLHIDLLGLWIQTIMMGVLKLFTMFL